MKSISHEVMNFLKMLGPIILLSEVKVDWLWRHNPGTRWFSRNNQKFQVPNSKTPESLNGQNNAHSRIRANDDTRGCKAHCAKCQEFNLKKKRKPPPQPATPHDAKKARRQREAKSNAEENLEESILPDEDDEDSEVEEIVANKITQTVHPTGLFNPLSVRGIASFFQVETNYIPEQLAEASTNCEIVNPSEIVRKLKQAASTIVNKIVNTFSEYGNTVPRQICSKLAVDMTKKYAAEKDEIEGAFDEDNDAELILFSLRGLFASDNDDSKDDIKYRAFRQTEPFIDDGKRVLKQRDAMAGACLKIMESQKEGSNEFRAARTIMVEGADG
jgi:hypothetical protein